MQNKISEKDNLLDEKGNIKVAGGFLIQVMPGCKDEYIRKLENKLANLKSCATMIAEGYTAEDIINEITDGDYQLLETKELSYECSCNKERFRRGLKSIGKDELKAIIEEDHQASITCNFCNSTYLFNENELKEILDELVAN